MLKKIVPVSSAEVFIDKQEAIVDLKTLVASPAIPTRLWYDADGFFLQDARRNQLYLEDVR